MGRLAMGVSYTRMMWEDVEYLIYVGIERDFEIVSKNVGDHRVE